MSIPTIQLQTGIHVFLSLLLYDQHMGGFPDQHFATNIKITLYKSNEYTHEKTQQQKIIFQIIFVLLQRCITASLRKLYSSEQLLGRCPDHHTVK